MRQRSLIELAFIPFRKIARLKGNSFERTVGVPDDLPAGH
jgi:hypothetical protein